MHQQCFVESILYEIVAEFGCSSAILLNNISNSRTREGLTIYNGQDFCFVEELFQEIDSFRERTSRLKDKPHLLYVDSIKGRLEINQDNVWISLMFYSSGKYTMVWICSAVDLIPTMLVAAARTFFLKTFHPPSLSQGLRIRLKCQLDTAQPEYLESLSTCLRTN